MKYFLCTVVLLLLHYTAIAQVKTEKKISPGNTIIEITKANIIRNLDLNPNLIIGLKNVNVKRPSLAHTAFFCKIEDKLERSAKIPVKMRIGDINYTNMMEGKNVHDPLSSRTLQLQQ